MTLDSCDGGDLSFLQELCHGFSRRKSRLLSVPYKPQLVGHAWHPSAFSAGCEVVQLSTQDLVATHTLKHGKMHV